LAQQPKFTDDWDKERKKLKILSLVFAVVLAIVAVLIALSILAWASLLTIFVCRNFPYSFRATFPTSLRVLFTRICFRSRFNRADVATRPALLRSHFAAAGGPMACKACLSENQSSFDGELNIHFPGRSNLSKPTVWAFPTLLICLDCGFSEFNLIETELRMLVEDAAADRL